MAPLAAAGLHFILFLGSVRENRNADRVIKYIVPAFEKNNITVTVFDAQELNFTKVVQPLHYYQNQEDAPQHLRDLNKIVRKADGFVMVTPEYHGSTAPGLSTLVDQFPPLSFGFRPAAIVTYSKGRFGGVRAAMQIRTWLSELGMVSIPSVLAIPKVEDVISKDGTTNNTLVLDATEALIGELVWFASAVKEYAPIKPILYKGKGWTDIAPTFPKAGDAEAKKSV